MPLCPHKWAVDTTTVYYFSVHTTDIDQKSRNLHHLYPGMGLQLGVFGFFPAIKITVIRQVHIYGSVSVKINTREKPYGVQRLWTYFVCIFLRMCSANTRISQLELHGWWHHYTERYSSKIFFLYLWSLLKVAVMPTCMSLRNIVKTYKPIIPKAYTGAYIKSCWNRCTEQQHDHTDFTTTFKLASL